MNENIKKVAQQAQFCFWDREEWRPKDAVIDWSCDYSKEFEFYTELLIKEVLEKVLKKTYLNDTNSFYASDAEAIKKFYGVK